MLDSLKLLVPALIPSWRFFDAVGPSPRIEYRLMADQSQDHDDWREFRPRPARLRGSIMARRLVWNPVWNETLFLVSCAERLIHNPTDHAITAHSQHEIAQRIESGLAQVTGLPWLQVRLMLVTRQGAHLCREVAYISPPLARTDLA